MQAGRLQCPSCGAPVSGFVSPGEHGGSALADARGSGGKALAICEHCGTALATVSCPCCFAMVFEGAKFCGNCGAVLQRTESGTTQLACPKCKPAVLSEVRLGQTPVRECGRCHGLWVEAAVFEEICRDRERQSAVLGRASETFRHGEKKFDPAIRYVPCPVCAQLMHRLNFAKCSGVVVDVCKGHGTWFDRDELQHIVDFIRSGGMDTAREREKAELEAARRRLEAARNIPSWEARGTGATFCEPDLFEIAGSIVEGVIHLSN